ncbi:ASCH domain-containing protein [Salmonella enterica]|nr:ASCH domain-containing protein [Salmonella enterica]EGT9282741.1 ASCH domain-containing protein [Salmonella enterica]EHE8172272.1 ASCH domain-containing protein [Salmonella enterica]
MQPNDITFFQRFQNDILTGRKTITIRDASESHFKAGDVLRVGRFEDDGYFCTIEVTGTSTVTLDTLNEKHAQQENMSLDELKRVIAEIYPNQTQFYVIDFKCL